VAHGQTLDEALKSLRPFAIGTLVEAANNGEDPLAILVFEEPKHPEAVLSEKDLFPIVLRYLRARQGLTQAEMAERLGIAQPSYAEYEKAGANPTLDTLLRLNKVLGHKLNSPLPEGRDSTAHAAGFLLRRAANAFPPQASAAIPAAGRPIPASRMLFAALRSAFSAWPHPRQQNSAWERRLPASV